MRNPIPLFKILGILLYSIPLDAYPKHSSVPNANLLNTRIISTFIWWTVYYVVMRRGFSSNCGPYREQLRQEWNFLRENNLPFTMMIMDSCGNISTRMALPWHHVAQSLRNVSHVMVYNIVNCNLPLSISVLTVMRIVMALEASFVRFKRPTTT